MAGSIAGSAVITLASDGAGLDTASLTSLGTQTVHVTGAVYAYALANVANGGTVMLANTHVGQAASGTLLVTNGGRGEWIQRGAGWKRWARLPLVFSAIGSFSGLTAGAATSLTVGYTSSAGGAYAGTTTLSLVSDGTGIDGLGTTTLAPQTVTVEGAAYAYASGVFGEQHSQPGHCARGSGG